MSATDDATAGIPDAHRVTLNSGGHYGRPQYMLSYWSEDINAHAFQTFETRHEAVGVKTILERQGRAKRPSISYRENY